ncbi:diacylglycerol kinase [Alphaproteobacteria bacterium GH1-50]|uniref:Diacylglycerol kinase n=1 Tax=Kangsaoukella pontilimi TaxID=2691042 RepID=A0A7C9IJ54_9RHOB|nr:diacylglycerol kinase family protein [Kangsaoukella pontilimi]MXQ09747.1 diacylglycerol kinase [Kangsaoukella pontilimi]
MAKRTDCIVILNQGSGKSEDKPGPSEIERAFSDHGRTVSVLTVSEGDEIAARIAEAVEAAPACIVAAGGDGTICAVAEALKGTEIELGVIPLGTFNYFARRFGLPDDHERAIEVICQGTARPMALGTVNGRVFLNNASLGLYPSILKEREDVYKRWGRSRLAAYWSVLVAMATVSRPLTMHIDVDGEARSEKSPNLFVAMSAYQLDEFGIEGADAIREGKFALLLAPDCGRFMLIWKALRVAMRGVRRGPDFTLVSGRRVTVGTRRSRALVAIDGEREAMRAPFEFEMLENALSVRLPGEAADRGQAA